MEKNEKVITRRDFLRAGAFAAAGGVIGLSLTRSAQGWNGKKSRVVLIRDKNVIDGSGTIQETILEKMMDQAVKTLVEASDVATAWRGLVAPSDVVGIKSNVWHQLRTPPALEAMIRARLMEAGVEEKNIAVDDRGVLRNPVFQKCTALINTRPMRTHDWSGLGTLLKNYIMFTPRPAEYHGNACEKLGAIWKFPLIKDKTRLNVLVMLTPQFHGVGPHSFSRDYVWNYSGLILSKDPVAADATGARIIQAKRNLFFQKRSPISPPPHHISTADSRFGLGNSSPDRIEVIKVGWDEGILI